METQNVALDFANSEFRNFPVESDCGPYGWPLRMPRLYSGQCPCGRLAGGGRCDYYLRPFEVHFHEQSVVGFDVTDSIDGDSVRGDYAGHLPGVVRSSFEWKTEFEPYGSERQVANEAIRG